MAKLRPPLGDAKISLIGKYTDYQTALKPIFRRPNSVDFNISELHVFDSPAVSGYPIPLVGVPV